MILTDREIKIAIESELIGIDPHPNEADAFTSTAVDLTLDPVINIFKSSPPGINTIIDPSVQGFNSDAIIRELTDTKNIPVEGWELKPKALVVAWTSEFIRLGIGTKIAARVEGRSSLARLGVGVHVTAPTIHAGFTGRIRLEMINHGIVPVLLKPGMRICQLIFETTLGTPEKGYSGQFYGQVVVAA